MNARHIITALALAATLPAIAQVHRCKDSSGQLVYSDRPCTAGQSGELIEKRKSQREIYEERKQAYQAEANKQERYAEERQRERMERIQAMEQSQYATQGQPKGYAERLAERNAGTQSNLMPPPGARPQPPRPARTLPPQMPAPSTVRCNGGYCSDNNGTMYHRQGQNFMTGPNGQACHKSGSSWICN